MLFVHCIFHVVVIPFVDFEKFVILRIIRELGRLGKLLLQDFLAHSRSLTLDLLVGLIL